MPPRARRRHADQLRDELLRGEIFYSLREAQVLIEAWRRHYNAVRPHSALGYRPPAPEGGTLAGCAAPTRSAGHPSRRAALNPLTFRSEHQLGDGHTTLARSDGTPGVKHIARRTLERPVVPLKWLIGISTDRNVGIMAQEQCTHAAM